MQPNQNYLCQKLLARPILVVSIRQISPHDQWNLLLLQLLCSDLEGIRHALDVDKDRCITTTSVSSVSFAPFTASHAPDLQRPCSQHTRPLILCHVWSRCALVVVHPLVLFVFDCVFDFVFCCRCRTCIARHYNVVVVWILVVWVLSTADLIVVVLEDIGLCFLVEVDSVITVFISRYSCACTGTL
jgi:hypothetical protein